MMTTSTGMALCDSGFGSRGRAWQRNQMDYPTLASIEASPKVVHDELLPTDPIITSEDIDYTVSLYHYLVNALTIDELCDKFNALKCKDWDSDKAYGISEKQAMWLENNGLTIGDTWNSYNSESNLSQTVQGANVSSDSSNMEFPEYILLQIHQGADVRGGYTDAKLFKVAIDYFTTNPNVYGDIDGIQVSNMWDGTTLRSDEDETQGEPVPVKSDSVINLFIAEY